MNVVPSIDQKSLTSSPFISSVPDYSICFLIKIQGLYGNVFENNPQDTTTPCRKNHEESTFMHHFPVNTYCFRSLAWYFKGQNKSTVIFACQRNYIFEDICTDNGMPPGSAKDLIWETLNVQE